jgi:hypothetical protein
MINEFRPEFCSDCGCEGELVSEFLIGSAADGMPTQLRIGADESDPLCKQCDAERAEKSVNAYLESHDW